MTLTFAKASELLTYDPETGLLTWKVKTGARVRIGEQAGKTNNKGYRAIGIDRKLYSGHRLAWLLIHGEWPSGVMNHLNGIKTDNRLANLEVTNAKGNTIHAYKHGLAVAASGEKSGRAKLTDAQVVEVRRSTESLREAAKKFGVSLKTISRLRCGAYRTNISQEL